MNKKEKAKALKTKQKKNHIEMLKNISNFKRPTKRDIDYMQGIMKGKKYSQVQRKELTKKLTEMENKLNEGKPETPETKEVKAEKVARTANKLVVSPPGTTPSDCEDKEPTTRAEIFDDVKKHLAVVEELCTKYARANPGGMSPRLNTVALQCQRFIRTTLRE